MQKGPLVAIVAVLALAVPATAAAPPEVVKLRREITALKAKVKRLTTERNTARREIVTLKRRLAPKPTGSVTLANGDKGDRARVTGLGVTKDGDVLGQIEYLGGLSCPDLGPWLRVEATFFDAAGTVIDTGSDTKTEVVAGARYPLEVLGATGAVRADAVVSVECL